MRAWVLLLLSSLAAAALWTTLVVVGSIQGWGRQRIAQAGDTRAFMDAAIEYVKGNHRGNVALALIENGRLFDEYFASAGNRVDGNTRFQAASLSKWVSAWGVLTLVEAGKIDLDAPVANYLKRWKLPHSDHDNQGVTVRRLLSHTAGMTDGLGYAGFAPGSEPQTLEASLTHAADASPGADGRVRVGIAPGTQWVYSGGGYTLLQLLIEELSGQSFEAYMQVAVLQPLGMSRSTFRVDEGEAHSLADSFNVDGTLATHYQFTSLAATSLYTTTSDLTRFLQAHLAGADSAPPGRGVLRPKTIELMRQPHASKMGADIWGLGVMLFSPNNQGDFIIGHDGSNEPAINTAARLDPAMGNGIVVLETGNRRLASRLAGEWVFWQTGNLDFLMVTMNLRKMVELVVGGWIGILLVAVAIGWRMRRGRRNRQGSA